MQAFSYEALEDILINKPSNHGPCPLEIEVINAQIKKFGEDLSEVAKKMENNYLPIAENQRIHSSCFDLFGKDFFLDAYAVAMGEGLMCLKDLAKGDRKSAAFKNASAISNMLNNELSTITCADSGFILDKSDEDTFGYASHEQGQTNADNIKHPFISLNPGFPPEKYNFSKMPTSEATAFVYRKLVSTLFHESFHNIGHLHTEGIEFAYSCDRCCFSRDLSKENKELSCKICSGNYKGLDDPTYKKDVKKWVDLNGKEFLLKP